MRIILVRHGQTEHNYLKKVQGLLNSPLNDTGRRQCIRLREELLDINFDYCYMSPLVRAVESAMILVGDRVETRVDYRLIDRDMGDIEGCSNDLYDAVKYWDYDKNCCELGIEPVKDIFKRCRKFLDDVLEKHRGQSILIVSHAACIRVIRHLLLKHDLKSNLLDISIDNCYMEQIVISD